MFQSFALLPILTAAENIEIPLRGQRTAPAARAARLRELLEMAEYADRTIYIHDGRLSSSGMVSR